MDESSAPGRPLGRLANRVALVTGASRGIGAAAAIRLAREGAHLVLVARTVGGLEEVDDAIREQGASATLVPFDLAEFDQIDALGLALYQRFGKLDILIGNAGALGTLSPVGHIKPKDWQQVIDTNLTANWRLIRSLDPLLRRSDAGRAVFVTSGAATTTPAYWGAYAASKAGLEALVRVYADEVEKTQIRVNLFNPGATRTALRAAAYPGENPAQLPAPETIAAGLVELVMPECRRHGECVAFQG